MTEASGAGRSEAPHPHPHFVRRNPKPPWAADPRPQSWLASVLTAGVCVCQGTDGGVRSRTCLRAPRLHLKRQEKECVCRRRWSRSPPLGLANSATGWRTPRTRVRATPRPWPGDTGSVGLRALATLSPGSRDGVRAYKGPQVRAGCPGSAGQCLPPSRICYCPRGEGQTLTVQKPPGRELDPLVPVPRAGRVDLEP